MGLFGFIGNVASSAIKVAATPVAAVVDVACVATGSKADTTKNLLKSAGDDLQEAGDEIMP